MILIVEGPDSAGKTTLAAALRDVFHARVFHAPTTPIDGITTQTSQAIDATLWSFVEQVEPDVIFDRAFPSEWVYGRAFEREFDEMQVTLLDRKAAELSARGILLRFKDPWAATRREHDHHVQGVRIHDVLDELYLEYVHRSAMEWVTLDAEQSIASNVRKAYKFVSTSR